MIHLDTSWLIRALVRDSVEDGTLRRWLRAGEPIRLSAIVWAEFLCGPVSTHVVEEAAELFGEPLPFDAADATVSAELFNASGRRRGTLADCMVAATALRAGAALATANRRDFHRLAVLGLTLASNE